MSAITIYLSELRAKFASGVATEHTYRPALQALLEGLAHGGRWVRKWTVPILLSVGVTWAVAGWLWPGPWYPFETATYTTFLSAIVATLASILAVVFAVVIVAFEILRPVLPNYAYRRVFDDNRVKLIVLAYIWTILLSLYCVLLTGKTVSVSLHNTTLLVAFYFVVCLIGLFPLAGGIISSARSLTWIEELAARIAPHPRELFGIPPHPLDTEDWRLQDDDPLFQLHEAAAKSLANDDPAVAQKIASVVTRRLLSLLAEDGADRRCVIYDFLPFYRRSFTQAVKVQHQGPAIHVLRLFETVLTWAGKNRIPYSDLIELHAELAAEIETALEANLDRVVDDAEWMLVRTATYFWQHAMPPEGDVWFFAESRAKPLNKDEIDATLQFQQLSEQYVKMLHSIGRRAVDIGRSEGARDAVWRLGALASEAVYMENLGLKQRASILSSVCRLANDLTVDYARKWPELAETCFPYHFLSGLALDPRENGPFYPTLVRECCRLLERLAKAGALRQLHLMDMGMVVRDAIPKAAHSEPHHKAVRFAVGVYDGIRRDIEHQWGPEQEAIYLALHDELYSFWRALVSRAESDLLCDLVGQVASASADFKYIAEVGRRAHDTWNVRF